MELFELEKENKNPLAGFLNEIRLKNRITFKSMYACLKEKSGEIKNIKSIYKLRNETDAQMLLAIPRLLFDKDESGKIISYMQKSEQFKNITPDAEQHNVLLLTSFVVNPAFFAMAWNWRALIMREIKARKKNNIIQFQIGKKFTVKDVGTQRQAASGKVQMAEYGKWIVDDEDALLGQLWIEIEEGFGKFVFKFDVFAEKLSFNLLVKYKIKGKSDIYEITLDKIDTRDSECGELIIASEEVAGIESCEIEVIGVECAPNDRT